MSGGFVPIMAVITAGAAAAARQNRPEEEEKMAKYNSDDLDGWEFKIVRSTMGRFSNREFLDKTCQHEAIAGWEMVEKFDEHRVRFKRRVEKRSMDSHLETDPYRTSVGSGSSSMVMIIIGLLVLAGGLFAFLGLRSDFSFPVIYGVIILIGFVALLFVFKKRS